MIVSIDLDVDGEISFNEFTKFDQRPVSPMKRNLDSDDSEDEVSYSDSVSDDDSVSSVSDSDSDESNDGGVRRMLRSKFLQH